MYYFVQSMTYQYYEYVILFNAIQVISYFFLVFLLSRSQSWCQYPPPTHIDYFSLEMDDSQSLCSLRKTCCIWNPGKASHFVMTPCFWIPMVHDPRSTRCLYISDRGCTSSEYIPFQFCFKSHLSLLNLGEIHLCCRLFVLTSLFLFSEQLGFNICPSTNTSTSSCMGVSENGEYPQNRNSFFWRTCWFSNVIGDTSFIIALSFIIHRSMISITHLGKL